MKNYFDRIGYPMPLQTNPAEFVLDLVSTDFASDGEVAESRLTELHTVWEASSESSTENKEIANLSTPSEKNGDLTLSSEKLQQVNFVVTVLALLHRSFIKSYRDVVAYGIRIVMYIGLAIMVGTVWLRLGDAQKNIQPFINALVSQAQHTKL